MKKFVVSFMAVFMMMISTALAATYTSPYPEHLGGDANYILCDGHMGSAWYIDRSSLNVQKYAPPQYIIAVNVVRVDDADRGNTAIADVKTYRFFYNIDLGRMYVDRNLNDDWRYINPDGSWAETGIVMPVGEMAFALAYNYKFYGNFGDAFYNRI